VPGAARPTLVVVCAVVVASLAATAPPASGTSPVRGRAFHDIDPAQGIFNLDHLVFIVQENRSFDHYFGTFPGARGIPRKADGTFKVCVPDPEAGGRCRRPYHDTGTFDAGGPHGWMASQMDVHNGRMDGFIRAWHRYTSDCKENPDDPRCRKAGTGPGGRLDVMGYHTGKEIPNYWAYARRYMLQDGMFAPADSWTVPSHLFMVSGWSARCAHPHDGMSCVSDVVRPDQFWTPADGEPQPYAWADITWLLYHAGVDWAYYVGPNTCVRPSDAGCDREKDATMTGPNQDPLPGFDTIDRTGQWDRIAPYGEYFSRAADGTLPAVTWIAPTYHHGEHPPDDLERGQAWVTRAINAIMQGPTEQWAHTAIFLFWDDWGGFYDHRVPRRVDENGYGIRVPSIVIGPWVRRNLPVDHAEYSFDSFLKLIEDRFLQGERLDGTNDYQGAHAWPDARPTVRELVPTLGDLSAAFDFSQDPLPATVLDPRPS
jgi:phospholipase C